MSDGIRARAALVFQRALDLPSERRESFVERECAAEPDLRREVDASLAAHAVAFGFLERAPDYGVLKDARDAGRRALAPGTVLDGKYRIDAMLATGGMGAVYSATQLALDRDVAIKVVDGEVGATEQAVARFEKEAFILAKLKHPHIVTIHDFGVAPDAGAFIVMERLEGHTLRAEIDTAAPLAPGRAAAIVGRVCSAVGAAHAAGIVHRDLKPDNVFLETTAGGRSVKLLDFGIAKSIVADAEPRWTTTAGAILGTPAYMSPEQCR